MFPWFSNFLEEISSLSHSVLFLYFFALIAKESLSLLAIFWNSAFRCLYLSFSPLLFTSCRLLFDHFQFALIHGPDIPGSYAILLFIASDLASITSHIHNWGLFLLWLHPFILSGVVSPLISSSILGICRPGEFLFQYPIILPFHTVHGFLRARILKWFAIPFSSGPHSVRPLHHDLSVLGGPTWHGLVSLS